MNFTPSDTSASEYTKRLSTLEGAWWKRLLDVQLPYRWHLKRLGLGKVLDVGCGIGRNLYFLDQGSIGVDHNPHSLDLARKRGCVVFEPNEFLESNFAQAGLFDSMLVAHVLEHLSRSDAEGLLRTYIPYVKKGGLVVVITPQEVGYSSDSSHVQFVDHELAKVIISGCGLNVVRTYSFPFPRFTGNFFKYNEFVTIGAVPA